MTADPRPWHLSVDTGGTFTDCWAHDPNGTEQRLKVLSSGALRSRVAHFIDSHHVRIEHHWSMPDHFFIGFEVRFLDPKVTPPAAPITAWNQAERILTLKHPIPSGLHLGTILEISSREEAPVLAARLLTNTPLQTPFPPIHLRLATTRGTNTLLEHKGAPVLFLVTQGFADLLRIRDQRRPHLFALDHQLPRPLYDQVIEIPERVSPNGEVITPLQLDEDLLASLVSARARGIESAAVALLHSYRHPSHEIILRDILQELGFTHVSLSHVLAPLIKILPRAQTAVINATLAPIMDDFFDHVLMPLNLPTSAPFPLIMTSAGGLERRPSCHAKDTLLSGPAGGVVGAATIAQSLDYPRIIAFDMGGTSTDVARFDHDYLYRFDHRVGEAHLFAPALRIATIAAGGGSICAFDTVQGLTVGPQSAGANPGPACYGNGGPLTLTDVNFLLDRIYPDSVSIPFNRNAAEEAFQDLLDSMNQPRATTKQRRAVLDGLLDIAVERTADAINTISLHEGAAPAEHALLAFGGAGPLHACAVAEKLGITTVLVPADAGLLSAFGLQHAVVERFAEEQVLQPLQAVLPGLPARLACLEAQAHRHLLDDGTPARDISTRRRIAELRLIGQDAALAVDIDPERTADLPFLFVSKYRDIYGYPPPGDKPIELVTLRIITSTTPPTPLKETVSSSNPPPQPGTSVFHHRNSLHSGDTIAGPAIIQDNFSTLYLAPAWTATVGSQNSIVLKKRAALAATPPVRAHHAVSTELFRHRFQNIVESMGARLQRAALSTNIKERADFSCALLDGRGRLIVNAPHIPVHLGALGLCVREVVKSIPLSPGDMIVTNHPAFGGSHLPDVTLISPIHGAHGNIIAFVVNRAHHAEIGGISPGSMPPHAASLPEEGVIIPPTRLFRNHEPDFITVQNLLTQAPFPTRNVADNLADLNAQSAANLHGVAQFESLLAAHGEETITRHLNHLYQRSRNALQHALQSRPLPLSSQATEYLDDGLPIHLTLSRTNEGLHIDYTGSAPLHPGNLNATPAIVQSAILYALRLFVQTDLPLNEGLLHDVRITLPPCFLNPPFPPDPGQCPPVVGGNVETSQRIVDTLLKALHLQACSQGTMNNLIFGDDAFGYYETIAGGAGAGPGYAGADALHTHMTNTAITDPEVLEQRYPVRLREFSIRRGSGGKGRFPGGNGVVREIEFLAPLTVSLLTQHRIQHPYGLEGGHPGALGRQTLIPASTTPTPLPPSATLTITPGDILRIETPGGGGWGAPSPL